MRKNAYFLYLSAFLIGVLLYSCTSWNSSLGRRAQHRYHAQENPETLPQRKLQEDERPSQGFQLLAENDTVFYTASGAMLNYYAGTFLHQNGEKVQGWVRFELQEAYTPGEMIYFNAPTLSDGRLLESGGEINLRAFQGNEELYLDPNGSGLRIQFPTAVKENMELFYGSRDRFKNLNWKLDPSLTALNFDSASVAVIEEPLLDSLEAAIMLANGDWSYLQESTIEYYTFNTKKLGWINCDRFYYDSTEKTDLIVQLKTPLPEGYITRAYLVFEGLNAVLPVYSYDQINFTATNIPLGSKVKLVVLGEMEKMFYLEIQELEITGGQMVWSSLTPCNQEKLKEKLGEI